MHKESEDGKTVTHVSTEEARSGATPHIVRYVLAWGLGLVIVAFIVIVGYGMLTT